MNKKRVGVFVCCLFIIIVLISFVSAGFFSDFWGKITGEALGEPCNDDATCGPAYYCVDGVCVEEAPITNCGNGVCDSEEDCNTCGSDCGSCRESCISCVDSTHGWCKDSSDGVDYCAVTAEYGEYYCTIYCPWIVKSNREGSSEI